MVFLIPQSISLLPVSQSRKPCSLANNSFTRKTRDYLLLDTCTTAATLVHHFRDKTDIFL
jgi:hypothetical protein